MLPYPSRLIEKEGKARRQVLTRNEDELPFAKVVAFVGAVDIVDHEVKHRIEMTHPLHITQSDAGWRVMYKVR